MRKFTREEILDEIVALCYSFVSFCSAFMVAVLITVNMLEKIISYNIHLGFSSKLIYSCGTIGIYFGVYIILVLLFNKAYVEIKKSYEKNKKKRLEKKKKKEEEDAK